jgi:predicted membrane GTPase involved in stress response
MTSARLTNPGMAIQVNFSPNLGSVLNTVTSQQLWQQLQQTQTSQSIAKVLELKSPSKL